MFVLYSKMFRGHNDIVYGRLPNFLYKNGLLKIVCNAIRFREYQTSENISKAMTYRAQLSSSLAKV